MHSGGFSLVDLAPEIVSKTCKYIQNSVMSRLWRSNRSAHDIKELCSDNMDV
jgi:hypothetical protein